MLRMQVVLGCQVRVCEWGGFGEIRLILLNNRYKYEL